MFVDYTGTLIIYSDAWVVCRNLYLHFNKLKSREFTSVKPKPYFHPEAVSVNGLIISLLNELTHLYMTDIEEKYRNKTCTVE